MTNPARRLHVIFTDWFNQSGNTQEVIRQLSTSGEAPEVTRLHLDAARASLIYQHAAEERNVAIAEGLDTLAGAALGPRITEAKGTGRARAALLATEKSPDQVAENAV